MSDKGVLSRRFDDEGNMIIELYEGDLNELLTERDVLKDEVRRLNCMIEHGIGHEDLQRDI